MKYLEMSMHERNNFREKREDKKQAFKKQKLALKELFILFNASQGASKDDKTDSADFMSEDFMKYMLNNTREDDVDQPQLFKFLANAFEVIGYVAKVRPHIISKCFIHFGVVYFAFEFKNVLLATQ